MFSHGLCNVYFQKISILPSKGFFFQDPQPPWKFQLSLMHFFQSFGLREPSIPSKFQPFCGWGKGEVRIFSGTAQLEFYLVNLISFLNNAKLTPPPPTRQLKERFDNLCKILQSGVCAINIYSTCVIHNSNQAHIVL